LLAYKLDTEEQISWNVTLTFIGGVMFHIMFVVSNIRYTRLSTK
jgi:hypothetical protein